MEQKLVTMSTDDLITATEASHSLKVSRMTIHRWIGQFERELHHLKKPCVLHSRQKIKAYITGIPRAGDTDVRRSLIMRYGQSKKGEPLEGVKKDLWAALAVAVYEADGSKLGGWKG